MIQRRKVIIGTLGVAATATAAGCSAHASASSGNAVWTNPVADNQAASPGASAPTESASAVQLTVTPADKATGVDLTKPITVAAASGTLQSVTVTTGKTKVAGAVQSDGTWTSTGDLDYSKTYKVVVKATDSAGTASEQTSTFTTVKPKNIARITFQANGLNALKAGGTYGAGQPVIVAFSHPVDKELAEKAIEITTSPKVEGKFHWVSNSIVHWRPAKYWTAGSTVKVSVNVLGKELGKGVYGDRNASANFRIGRQLIAIADSRTHITKVMIDGKVVRTMKSSFGMGGTTKGAQGQEINFWTAGGPHVVLSKELWHTMNSSSYGVTDPSNPYYYGDDKVQYCTRISYSGEFLHAAPWNHSLGVANKSHGCINLSVEDAKWVYENFMVGDVVDVKNSPRTLGLTNGLGDWTVSYDKYGN
ncbi:Ig-like domain-containing protein [Actinoplanes sp. NPDC020271]|uniref:L,D-transpeptidase n=1 Tax=Actinoplanes sp. NPDC020271 TaxID=3363896 RepID=UPI0037B8F34B